MLGLATDGFYYEWDAETNELRRRVNPGGSILSTISNVESEEAASALVDNYLQEKNDNVDTLRQQAEDALATNRTQSAQNTAIIEKADNIIGFSGSTITQSQIIATMKDLAQGVKLVAEHDQENKKQLNALIRLVIGELDGTD